MSYGSNALDRKPCPWSKRQKARNLRTQLVRQADCVRIECREMARQLLADAEWMSGEWQRQVRIPRRFRKPLTCLDRSPAIVLVVDVALGKPPQ